MLRTVIFSLILMTFVTSARAEGADYWVEPMKKVHAGFSGNKGYVAQIGDSITHSMAFWSHMSWADLSPFLPEDSLPKKPSGKQWKNVIKGARDKGGKHGNYSGWKVGNLLKVIDKVISEKKPEVALVMIGTNDVRGNKVPANYESGLDSIIQKLIAAKCVPIMSTIPPMRGKKEGVDGANAIVKKIAEKYQVPLIDYHKEIMDRVGDKWDGTLLSKDGIHPSGPVKDQGTKFTPENLKKSGYMLRTYLSFAKFREVYFKALGGK